mmetsp:Transcript_78506/g.148203  ORF Transcript_78506/g.148203 Transcript_78506/m.148203 type:complete len:230 (+) Transcript_78506:109-798(+)
MCSEQLIKPLQATSQVVARAPLSIPVFHRAPPCPCPALQHTSHFVNFSRAARTLFSASDFSARSVFAFSTTAGGALSANPGAASRVVSWSMTFWSSFCCFSNRFFSFTGSISPAMGSRASKPSSTSSRTTESSASAASFNSPNSNLSKSRRPRTARGSASSFNISSISPLERIVAGIFFAGSTLYSFFALRIERVTAWKDPNSAIAASSTGSSEFSRCGHGAIIREGPS